VHIARADEEVDVESSGDEHDVASGIVTVSTARASRSRRNSLKGRGIVYGGHLGWRTPRWTV
jgi:hypothetical protein